MLLTDQNYVDKAEQAIESLSKGQNGKYFLTTSKIRRLLSLTSSLYDEVKFRDFEDVQDKLAYLRIQFIYQAGREPSVKDFVINARILEALAEIEDKETLVRFSRYMEALVAYFRFYGGE